MILSRKFNADANEIAFNLKHRNTIRHNMSKYKSAVLKGKGNYQNLELARERAAYLKRLVLKNWSKYLIQFESNCIKQGGHVHWAETVSDSITILSEILSKHQPQYVMKSKSMTTEEIQLNEAQVLCFQRPPSRAFLQTADEQACAPVAQCAGLQKRCR